MVLGSLAARPTIIRLKKMPIDSTMPAFWNVARMPEAWPRSSAGTEFMMAVVFGGEKTPDADAVQEDQEGERPVVEVGRQQHQQGEAGGAEQHPAGGEPARAVAVR